MNYKDFHITKRWQALYNCYWYYAMKIDRSRGFGPFVSERDAINAVDEYVKFNP